jgi:recombination protein RecT
VATQQSVKDAAVATQEKKPLTIQDLVERSAKELGRALPAHMRPERIVRIALTTLKVNPKLYQCDQSSFLAALFQCAQLGLEPNIEGQAYIIPYNTSVKIDNQWQKRLVAQFQIGYKGYVELFWRHQSALSLQMETVHRDDVDSSNFSFDLGANSLKHTPNMFKDRGEVIGYYAVAQLKGGGTAIKVMSKDEIMNHAKRFSKCWDAKEKTFMKDTPWASHFDAMAKKTVLIQLMKLLPKSIEIQRALAMDETVKFKPSADMIEIPPAEIEHKAEEPAVVAAPPAAREPGEDG